MNNKPYELLGSGAGMILTAVQTQQVFQIISLVLTCLSIAFSIAFTLYKWFKEAKNRRVGTLADEKLSEYADAIENLPEVIIEGEQTITGFLTGTVAEFDTVYSKFISDGSNWDTVHNKLSNPVDLPTGNGQGVSFSSNDNYLAVAHDTSPFLTVYKRNGDVFTKLSNPADLPTGDVREVSFSSDDTYLAVAHGNSPFLTIYKTTLINPTTLISPALNEVPSGYHDLGYAKESGVKNDEIEMVSIFR